MPGLTPYLTRCYFEGDTNNVRFAEINSRIDCSPQMGCLKQKIISRGHVELGSRVLGGSTVPLVVKISSSSYSQLKFALVLNFRWTASGRH